MKNKNKLPPLNFGGAAPHCKPIIREKTFDDSEPVLEQESNETLRLRNIKPCSCKGRQLHEKIQEQKDLEAFENDWWGDGVQE